MGFSASRSMTDDPQYIIDSVAKKSAAYLAGVKVNDVIISINEIVTKSGPKMVGIVHSNGKNPVKLVVARGENILKFTLQPDPKKLADDSAMSFLGFIPKQKLERVSLVKAIKYGNETTLAYAKVMLTVLFSKEVKNAVGGPLAIANETQNGVKRGAYGFLQLMAALSLSLGVFNLMPIPVVDGGQMVLLLVEGVKRKRLAPRTWELAQIVGIAMIAVIFLLVMTVDIGRIANGTLFRR
jgi:regulator of sigma E protease